MKNVEHAHRDRPRNRLGKLLRNAVAAGGVARPTSRSRGAPGAGTWVSPLDWAGCFAVFALLHSANAFDALLGLADVTAPIDVVISLALYLVAFGLLCHHHRLRWLRWLLQRQPLLCTVLIVAVASWLWSIAPEFTWTRSILLLGTTLIGVYVGYCFAPRTLMVILLYTFVILVVGGVVLALLLPEDGQTLHKDHIVWIGLARNRNHFGFVAAIAAVFFIVGTLFGRVALPAGIALALLSVLALAMTRSATSLVAFLVGVLTLFIFMLSKRIKAPSILTLLLVLTGGSGVAILVATTNYFYDFADVLDRNYSFTGRTDIWLAAWQAMLERPWLGWGYGTLWSTSEESVFVQKEILGLDVIVGHAHNSFLNIASELGVPTGVAAIVYLLTTMFQATRTYIHRASPFALFAIALVFMVMIESIAEARLFERRQFFWVLFVAVAVSIQWPLQTRKLLRLRRKQS